MKKLIVAAAVIIFTLIGLTACSSANDEPIRLGDYSSYAIASDTALRNCTAEDISEILKFFNGLKYERVDMPADLTADSVGLFAYSTELGNSGIGFGGSGDERYFSFTPDMAVTEICAGADFFGKNSRVYRITNEDYGNITIPLYNLASDIGSFAVKVYQSRPRFSKISENFIGAEFNLSILSAFSTFRFSEISLR